MKMTKKDALNAAIATMSTTEGNEEAIGILTKMVAQLSKERKAMSDEAKAAISMKRKADTAEKRAKVVAAVSPVLRKYLDTPRTAKELFEVAKNELPEDYTWNKVQAMLIREMKPELEIIQKKGSADHYVLKG